MANFYRNAYHAVLPHYQKYLDVMYNHIRDTVDDQISGEMETAKKSFCPFSTSDKNN